MPYKSLLALPVLAAGVLFLFASVSPQACSSPALPAAPAAWPPQATDLPSPPAVPEASPMTAAPEPPPPPEPDQPRCHTLTIYNGDHVTQQTFVWRCGSWRSCGDGCHHDACFRDDPCSPWRSCGTYRSPCRAEKPACCLRATGNLTSFRHHCD